MRELNEKEIESIAGGDAKSYLAIGGGVVGTAKAAAALVGAATLGAAILPAAGVALGIGAIYYGTSSLVGVWYGG